MLRCCNESSSCSYFIFDVCSLPNVSSVLQVTASAWLNDLRNQIERTRILSTVYRSASALGSRLPSMASAKAKVAGAGAILRPVSSRTQVSISHLNIAFNCTTQKIRALFFKLCFKPPFPNHV